ncbi:MAG: anaerobic ribonucleoside-triphosphate reductase activating protein [Methanobrevibacter sp.]|jgi:pyruvate formate lyase activating enzyme|nr:anaerobic ribonucleoside-triphosphate reductase activating protein [Candidatus Methanovirga aequatorialis]
MNLGTTIISSIEFQGKISLVIFMAKCPLKCPFCHNWELINKGEDVSLSEVFKIIDSDVDYIDAVVISGGEPLSQLNDLKKILIYSKSLLLETKLDTSGIYPDRLEEVVGLVDYISIDVKAPFNKYKEVTGANIGENVKKSVEIANNAKNTYVECRTTFVPSLLSPEDIEEIGRNFGCDSNIGCDEYTIQQFRNQNVFDKTLREIENPNPNELKRTAKKVKKYFKMVKIKTSEFGCEVVDDVS